LAYNKGVLASINKYTKEDSYEVVMVDNGSTDGTREWLKDQANIKVILNDENFGFPKGCNIGIAASEVDNDILLLNNDIEVCHNWLDNLQTALYSDPKIGAVQGLDALHFKGTLDKKGKIINFTAKDTSDIHQFAIQNNKSDSNRWKYTNFLTGYCVLLKREVIDKIGLLDERFSPGNFEDDDLSFRILSAGYYLLRCHDCFIHHFGSQSFRKNEKSYWELIETNSKKFTQKWGFHAWDKFHQKDHLLHVLDADSTKPINVLHIECGLGATLFEIKNRYPLANLYGIEINEHYAKVIQGVIKTVTTPVITFPLAFEEHLFDIIMIDDKLERSENPREFLINIKKYLKPDGQLIVAIQNVMHYSVLKKVLHGHWHYGDKTTLNKENRIFLTANDIQIFFKECGYLNPFIFHWYSPNNEADDKFIKSLCSIAGQDKEYLYRTYLYIVRSQNNQSSLQREEAKRETIYLLRRIENEIQKEKSLALIKNYLDFGWLTIDEIREIIDKAVVNKVLIHSILDSVDERL